MKRILAAVALAVLALGQGAQAAPVTLAQAERAVAVGDWATVERARDVLIAWNPVQGRVLLARAALERRQPARALEIIKAAERLNGANRATQLIASVAHFRLGQTVRAEMRGRRALDLSTTDRDRAQVRQILNDVKRARKWQVNGAVGLVPSSNVAKASSAKTVQGIFGEGRVNGETVESGVGLNLFVNAARLRPLSNGAVLKFRLGGSARLYKREDLNAAYLWTGLEFTSPVRNGRFEFGSVTFTRQFDQGQLFADTVQVSLGHGWRTRRGAANRVTMSLSERTRHDTDNSDSTVVSLAFDQAIGLAPGRAVRWGLGRSERMSAADYIANSYTNGYVEYSHGFRGGWKVTPRLSVGYGLWDRRQPQFLERREDRLVSASFGVVNYNLSYWGLSPNVTLSASRNKSNISIYSYDDLSIFMGLENAF